MMDIGKWIKLFDYNNLDKFFKAEKEKGSMGESLGRMLVGYLIYTIPISLIVAVALMIYGATESLSSYGQDSTVFLDSLGGMGIAELGMIFIGILFVLGIIIEIVVFFMANGLMHLIARALGGKGSFAGFLHYMSYITAVGFLVMLVLDIIPTSLLMLPAVGDVFSQVLECLFTPIGFAGWLYFTYVTVKAIAANYGLSEGRAIATILLSIAVWMIPFVIIFIIALLIGLSIPAGGSLLT
jgi:hypothetical protein